MVLYSTSRYSCASIHLVSYVGRPSLLLEKGGGMALERRYLGRYLLRTFLGRGGSGEVYLADDPVSQRSVAIKIIWVENKDKRQTGSAKQALRPFRREIKALSLLKHPHILPLIAAGEQAIQGRRCAYLVMPYCKEGSLDYWLQRHFAGVPIPPETATHMINQLADALQQMHNLQIIHQDVKPSNVLLHHWTAPDLPEVLLADFGIAKFLMALSSSSDGTIRGTHAYMAPEQWEGLPVPASDQYALAVMAYELLTGTLPFEEASPVRMMYQHLHTPPPLPSAINPLLSGRVDRVLLKALEKEPRDRFPCIAAFAYALWRTARSAAAYPGSVEDEPIVQRFEEARDASEEEDEPWDRFWEPAPSHRLSPAVKRAQLFGAARPFSPPRAHRRVSHRVHERPREQLPGVLFFPRLQTIGRIGGPLILIFLVLLLGGMWMRTQGGTYHVSLFPWGEHVYSVQPGVVPYSDATTTALAYVATDTALNPNPYPPHHGNLILDDTLRDDSGWEGWDAYNSSLSHAADQCAFTGGAYHVTAVAGDSNQDCVADWSAFSDFAYEVRMTILQGDAGGLSFRSNQTGGYVLLVHQDGRYELDVVKSSTQIVLLHGVAQAWKNGENQSNIVAVVVLGSDIKVYINHQFVAHVSDSTSGSGQVGLIADSSKSTLPTNVAFTDARVWNLS